MAKLRYEEMSPDELEQAVAAKPVAYLPLGMLEWHGWHLPVGNDALKAQAICLRLAERGGGVVLPPWYVGVGGGHQAYPWSIAYEAEPEIENLLLHTFDRLAQFGFRVIVAITGHYPGEQVRMVKQAAARHREQPGSARVLAMPEYEPYPGPERPGDHAGKWETSILAYLRPELVDISRISEHPDDPLHGVYGEDPRIGSAQLGGQVIEVILAELAKQIELALATD
jgi:creatinine amidohydrolase